MSTTSVNELYPKTRKLAYDLEMQLQQVEDGLDHIGNMEIGLSELKRQIDILKNLINNEIKSKRGSWNTRILELENQSNFLSSSLSSFIKKNHRDEIEKKEREELLSRRATNIGSNLLNGYAEEATMLNRSKRMMGEIIQSGQSSLDELLLQKDKLKYAQRRLFDMLNSLGLSNTLLRIVERREYTDKMIVYIGMVLITLLIIFLVWFL